MSDIILSSGVRGNLLSLQNTARLLERTQERLATGLKVNSALDDPTAFFTAASLNNRAADLARLLDSISLGVQTLEAADVGIKAITDLLETAQASARQALQAPGPVTPAIAAFSTGSVAIAADAISTATSGTIANDAAVLALTGTLTITGPAGSTTLDFGTGTASGTTIDTEAELAAAIGAASTASGTTIAYTTGGGSTLSVTAAAGESFTITGTSSGLGGTLSNGTFDPNSQLAGFNNTLSVTVGSGAQQDIDLSAVTSRTNLLTTINAGLTGATASIVSNNLVITADNTTDSLTIVNTGGTGGASLGLGNSAPTTGTPVNNVIRQKAETDYNALLTQITELSRDASFNGNNLLQSDKLKIFFNENGTSSLTINGVDFDANGLSLTAVALGAFQTDTNINSTLDNLEAAILQIRTQAGTFGSNLSVVETRQQFTASLINTLETGGANLILADINEEGANLLALQTRQQLSTTALSLASQADQNVLRLFG